MLFTFPSPAVSHRHVRRLLRQQKQGAHRHTYLGSPATGHASKYRPAAPIREPGQTTACMVEMSQFPQADEKSGEFQIVSLVL